MKDVLQTYKFNFEFNTKDSKKQLKSISDDMLNMLRSMDDASSKMKVFTNFVGYLEQLDTALNQFKNEHKNDFATMFGGLDADLTQSLESALGMSIDKLGKLNGLRDRINQALANKADTKELRGIANDINALFTAIGRPVELDIDGVFKGKGNLKERIEVLNNALYKFYLQYQFVTNSIKGGFASGGLNAFEGLSDDAKKEVAKLADAYDELIDLQTKLKKAQGDLDKMKSKRNSSVVEEYSTDTSVDSINKLTEEFDALDAQIKSSDPNTKEYYDNILKITNVILKLNSALKTIRTDNSLLTIFQGAHAGEGYGHMLDKLSKYATVRATQFENQFLGNVSANGMQSLIARNMARTSQVFPGYFGGDAVSGGGTGKGNGAVSGGGPDVPKDDNVQQDTSAYKKLTQALTEYKNVYSEYKKLEDEEDYSDELESKGDRIDELKESMYQLADLSDDAYEEVSQLFNIYENGKSTFDELKTSLMSVLNISKDFGDESENVFTGKLKTYEQLLTIVDKINALGVDEVDFKDSGVQQLAKDLKDLYATEEQLADVDDILQELLSGDIDDIQALNKLTKLFGVEIPGGIKTASQKIDEFYNKIETTMADGLNSEFAAGEYKAAMEAMKNELQALYEQGRITEDQFKQLQKSFNTDVTKYVESFINKNNTLKQLNELNNSATATDDQKSLESIVKKRQEILALAEKNGTLSQEQLANEKAITDEIEKRIDIQKQAKQHRGGDSKFYQLSSAQEAMKILEDGIGKDTMDKWNVYADAEAKLAIEKALSANENLHNAALNVAWENYKKNIADISFDDFLNKEISMYRGKKRKGNFDVNDYLSFTPIKDVAEQFGDVLETVIKPIETLGSINLNHENELFVPKGLIENRTETQDWLKRLEASQSAYIEEQARSVSEFLKTVSDDDIRKLLEKRGIKDIDQIIARAKELNDTVELLDDSDGQIKLFEEAAADAQKAESATKDLADEMERVDSIDGQTSFNNYLSSQSAVAKNAGDAVTNAEITSLEQLRAKLVEVKDAVDAKTQAFEQEYVTVDAAVEAEIASLTKLKKLLGDIQNTLQFVLSANINNIGDIDFGQATNQTGAAQNIFADIKQILSGILTVLQGFTGLESDGKNSLKHKEPAAEHSVGGNDTYEMLAKIIPENIATDGTLSEVRDEIKSLVDTLKTKFDDDNKNTIDTHKSLNTLISALSANIKTLQDVMNGVIVHQRAQKSDTTKAMTRIQDPNQLQNVIGLAKGAANTLGSDAEIESYTALADGLVKLEGAYKNASGQWEGFTVKINEHNEAVDLAVKKHSAFAKELNKPVDAPLYDKAETEARAQKHLDAYRAQGKNATVQFKDNGKYTISVLEEIDGISKTISQTFDENDALIERTTARMSNAQQLKLENLKKVIDAGVVAQNVGQEDSIYRQYQKASDELDKLNAQYRTQSNLSDDEILSWNQQIKLVQKLGSEVEKLIMRRKSADISDVFKSNKSKKLSEFDLDHTKLKADIAIPDSFNQQIQDARSAIENAVDDDALKIAMNNWDALKNAINAAAVAQDLYVKKQKSASSKPDQFTKDLDKQKDAIKDYAANAKNILGITPELITEISKLQNNLNSIGDDASLDAWEQEFSQLKTKIANTTKSVQADSLRVTREIAGQTNLKFSETGFKVNSNNIDSDAEMKVIKDKYKELMKQISDYNIAVRSGQKAELDGILDTQKALYGLIDAYKQKHNIVNVDGKKPKEAYGTNVVASVSGKLNSLKQKINSDKNLPNSSVLQGKMDQLEDSLKRLNQLYSDLGDKDPTKEDKEAFQQASAECNNLYREVDGLVKAYDKLHNRQDVMDTLPTDVGFDVNDIDQRKQALTDFVQTMYGTKATIGDFDDYYHTLLFTINNGDGTVTSAKATFDKLGASIVSVGGDAEATTGRFKKLMNAIGAQTKKLWVYAASRFGIDEIIQQVRKGIGYVREIDKALTELKKVTNETDEAYANFLQDMAKTGSVIGSTVSDLTTMASEWARLGYSMEEAGRLAKSTAVLLNVSEFKDATTASEALISTMQAFQYTADQSMHVVDILNEVKVICLLIQ